MIRAFSLILAAFLVIGTGAEAKTVRLEDGRSITREWAGLTGRGKSRIVLAGSNGLVLDGADDRLKVDGVFGKFVVRLITEDGARKVALSDRRRSGGNIVSRSYDLSTIFDAANGLRQTLVFRWKAADTMPAARIDNRVTLKVSPVAAAVVAPVPVPASGLLLLGALGGAALLRRRKTA